MNLKERYTGILNYFVANQLPSETELFYDSPYQLLVSVILSAQCTDKRVNLVTPALFNAFPDAQSMAAAMPADIFPLIKSISYPNNKAKHLHGMACMMIEKFGGEVPSEVEKLVLLPGVGRKTANVIASVVFGQARMAVDTHVFRVSKRLGLTVNATTPLQCEMQLVKHIPEALIHKAHHWLILHGRYVCLARKPKCSVCNLRDACLFFELEKKKLKGKIKKS